MKEKIEEYLEIYNQSDFARLEKLKAKKNARRTKTDPASENQTQLDNGDPGEATCGETELDDEEEVCLEDLEDEEDTLKRKEMMERKKRWRKIKKRPKLDDEIIEDPRDLVNVNGKNLEPLPKLRSQPAQDRAYKELSSINERIASLVQVRQMGLATPENREQLKQLMRDRKKKSFELRRLQSKQRASNRYRVKRRQIVINLVQSIEEIRYFISFISLFRSSIYLKRNQNCIRN